MNAHDDGSVQGFLDFSVQNIESEGVNFTLEYNTDYVVLSDAADNTEIQGGTAMYNNFPSLRLNETDFAENTFMVFGEIPSTTEGKYGKVALNVIVNQATSTGGYITEKTISESDGIPETIKVVSAGNREVQLGSISFKIKDPAAFAKLTSEELMSVFRIETTDGGGNAFAISYVDLSAYPPVVFYDQNSHLDYDFAVQNTIASITVNNADVTVSAAEIYRYGNEGDLISYLNSHMQDITVTYADGTQIVDTIVWGADNSGYSCDSSWNPRGGVYNIRQNYNDDWVVTAKLTVTPVTLTGYTSDYDYITYPTAADVPVDLSGLDLPVQAKSVFDKVVPGRTDYLVGISNNWRQTDGPAGADFFVDKAEGEYTFTADVTGILPAWVTPGSVNTVSVIRAIGEATPLPLVSAVVDADGLLTITVEQIDLTGAGMDFVIRMPNGEVLDPDNFTNVTDGGLYEVTLDAPAAGQATIKLKAEDMSVPQQAVLRQYINMGNRLGEFSLAAQETGKPRSEWVNFAFEPRRNIYTGGNYTFDYSGARSYLMPFDDNMTAPATTITLPLGDTVATTYSGDDGTEPGALHTVKVESWVKTAGDIVAGQTVTFTGILADTTYVNMGRIQNPDGVQIVLTLTVSETVGEEKLAELSDIRFDKKQVGYGSADLQSAPVELENIGTLDIAGLTVSIDSDDFVLESLPSYALAIGDKTSFSIRTKLGLPVGVHTAKVTVGSNRNDELASFNVTFEVTATPVYRLNLVTDNPTAGTVTAPDGYTYAAGDLVTLDALPEDDCAFEGWTSLFGPSPSFEPSSTALEVTFTMPDLDGLGYDYITIQGSFSEGAAARLKLMDLQLFNPDGSQNDLLNDAYNKIAFDPTLREYLAVVASGAETNSAVLKIDTATDAPAITLGAALTAPDGATQTLTVAARAGEDGVYEINDFPVAVGTAGNLLTVSLTANGETREYNIHLYRKLNISDMLQLQYGNSPYGLIMRDAAVADGDKALWKAEFDKGNCFTAGYTPSGGKADLVYYADAWGRGTQATNYDKDDMALFVYAGDSFTDPGIVTLTDSLGNTIDLTTVKAQAKVSEMNAVSPKNLMDDFRTVKTTTVSFEVGQTCTALADLRVRPGVYFIDYTFKDFDGSYITVQRPLIMLAARGDMNLDQQVDAADGELIANRYNSRLPYENLPGYESGGRLYLYRICDANIDRNVNAGDRNIILRQGSALTQFYK